MNILITGGSKRIGKEIAINFAKQGYNIILHYNTSKKEALQTKLEINKISNCEIIKGDLRNFKSTKKIFSEAKKKFKHINHLIKNLI